MMRLNQFIARSGIASRRKAEDLIKLGLVTINGKIITELATQVELTDEVFIKGEKIQLLSKKYYLLNKPLGYTCTNADVHAKKTIFSLLPNEPGLFSVGRLDVNTSGLVIVTNDGELANKIIHPSAGVTKTYKVTLAFDLTEQNITTLLKGVELDDGPANFESLKRYDKNQFLASIKIGRNRIVRRMFSAVGNNVVALHRVRIGNLDLEKENLRAGEFKETSKKVLTNVCC
jgi:23S rRNA pseudouridine2605 synthase